MKSNHYHFDLIRLHAGDWSLVLLHKEHVVGGFVGSDFSDLYTAGTIWLASHGKQTVQGRNVKIYY